MKTPMIFSVVVTLLVSPLVLAQPAASTNETASSNEQVATGDQAESSDQAETSDRAASTDERPRRRVRGADGHTTEHLKPLEPLLGKYRQPSRTGAGNGAGAERHTYWNPNKQMIVTKMVDMRDGPDAPYEWQYREFFYWNSIEQRIEMLRIQPINGVVHTYEVTLQDENHYALTQIGKSRESRGGGMATVQWIVSDEGLEIRGTRTNSEGLGRQMRFEMSRIE